MPPGAAYHGKISIKAYPTRESGEMVWAYLGPREHMPEDVPQLEVGMLPAAHRYVSKRLQMCNWAHSMEGALDTAHFSFLHMPAPSVATYVNPATAADANRLRWLREDPMPQFTIVEHDVGFAVGGARKADGSEPSSAGPVDVSAACPVLANFNLTDNLDSKGAPLFRRFVERVRSSPAPVSTPRAFKTAAVRLAAAGWSSAV